MPGVSDLVLVGPACCGGAYSLINQWLSLSLFKVWGELPSSLWVPFFF